MDETRKSRRFHGIPSENAEISQQCVTESNYQYEEPETYNASHAAGVDEIGAGLPRLPYCPLQI
jgi:hypothetical protein